MKILGIKNAGFNTSACVLIDGEIDHAICEERITREKRSKSFPKKSIEYCLRKTGLTIDQFDYITIGWNPVYNLEKHIGAQSGNSRYLPEFLYSVPSFLMSMRSDFDPGPVAELNIPTLSAGELKIRYVDHHLAHCGGSFFDSPFEEAALLSIDAFGEDICTLLGVGRGNTIEVIEEVRFPNSIGILYQVFTQFLGMKPDNDEWKVMGASPYGDPSKYYDKVRKIINYDSACNELYDLDIRFNDYHLNRRRLFFNERFTTLFGPPIQGQQDFDERGYDLAAAIQKVTEEIIFSVCKKLFKKTGLKKLCFSGGVAMNCLANGKIIHNTDFDEVFLNDCPGDDGTSRGAALYYYHCVLKGKKKGSLASNYLGPSFSDDEIVNVLEKSKINYEAPINLYDDATGEICGGKVVGWVQGKMEFGERALGNRSILGDPRRKDIKEKINAAVKFREPYRPFAPAILWDKADEFFIDPQFSPYMEKVCYFKPQVRDKVPGVVHVDGSGRLQSVRKEDNEVFYTLIENFFQKTGIPILLNTSFNIQGEPIVCVPQDAINTFFKSGLDILYIGKYKLSK